MSPGALVVLVGALLLLVSLFLDWYGLRTGAGISAWNSFEVIDLLLATGALLVAFWSLPPQVPVPFIDRNQRGIGAALMVPVVIGMVILVVASLISNPPAARGAGIEVGAWLALVAVLLLAAGAILSRANVSFVISVRASTDAPTTPVGSFPEESEDRTAPLPPEDLGGATQVRPPARDR